MSIVSALQAEFEARFGNTSMDFIEFLEVKQNERAKTIPTASMGNLKQGGRRGQDRAKKRA